MIPIWAISAIASAAVAGAVAWHLGGLGPKATLATERAAWAQERATAAGLAASASEAYRAKEQGWNQRIAEVQANGTIVANAIAADAAGTQRTVSGLRNALDIAAHALASGATGSPTAAPDCAPSIEAARVRSDMLASLAERGATVAEFAERSYSAAVACVSADAVTR